MREVKIVKRLDGTHRTAVIKTSAISNGYTVWFYYDNDSDFEWKRGAHGLAMDNCDTLKQAEGKAKRYIAKDFE